MSALSILPFNQLKRIFPHQVVEFEHAEQAYYVSFDRQRTSEASAKKWAEALQFPMDTIMSKVKGEDLQDPYAGHALKYQLLHTSGGMDRARFQIDAKLLHTPTAKDALAQFEGNHFGVYIKKLEQDAIYERTLEALKQWSTGTQWVLEGEDNPRFITINDVANPRAFMSAVKALLNVDVPAEFMPPPGAGTLSIPADILTPKALAELQKLSKTMGKLTEAIAPAQKERGV